MPSKVLSTERVEASSDSESSVSNSDHSPANKKNDARKTHKITKSTESSDDTSEDSDVESSVSSVGSSSSTSSSKSSSPQHGKRKDPPITAESLKPNPQRRKTGQVTVQRIHATTYVPPQGYLANNSAAQEFSSKTKNAFADLEGKEIWYLSAPSSMPMSELSSIDLALALKGNPVLSQDDTRYVLSRAELGGETLLLPDDSHGEFSASSHQPTRFFHVKEIVQHPSKSNAVAVGDEQIEGTTEKIRFFAQATGEKKLPRRQPESLRGRYIPFGVPESYHEANEDVEMNDAVSKQLEPVEQTSSQKSTKSARKANTEEHKSPKQSSKKSKLAVTIDKAALTVQVNKKKKKSA